MKTIGSSACGALRRSAIDFAESRLEIRRPTLRRRFDEAVPKLRLAIQEDPGLPEAYRVLAACYAHMGRLDDAREIVGRLRTITSVLIPDASFLRNPEHREFFLSGLRLAAGEET